MTLLQTQLQSLKLLENQNARSFDISERPSILFSFKEAATIGHAKITEMGLEGFLQLTQIIPELHQFQNFLFLKLAHKNLDRNKLTSLENQEISELLIKILVLISPSFTNINSLKLIEYLLRNFEIHKFEAEKLVYIYLNYHSTPLYTKLLQTINLANSFKWYSILDIRIVSGQGFDRSFLVNKIVKNNLIILEEFAQFLIDYSKYKVFKSVQTGDGDTPDYFISKSAGTKTPDSEIPAFRFYCVLVYEVFKAFPQNENVRRIIKTNFWKFLTIAIDHQQSSFLSGIVFMTSLFSIQGLFTMKELRIIIQDLLANAKKIDQELIKLILLACSFDRFKITGKFITALPKDFETSGEQTFKHYSNLHIVIKLADFINQSFIKHATIEASNLILFHNLIQLLLKYDTKFTDSPHLKSILFIKISKIFQLVLLSKNFDTLQNQLNLFKKTATLFTVEYSKIVQSIFEIEVPESENSRKFKQNFKKIFGEFLLYGVIDEADFFMEGGAHQKVTSIVNLRTCSEAKKLVFFERISSDLVSNKKTIKTSEKKSYLSIFSEMLTEENHIEISLYLFKIILNITDSMEYISKARSQIILKIRSRKASDFENSITPLLRWFLKMSDNNSDNSSFCQLFEILLESKFEIEKVNVIFLKDFFETKYENLVCYFQFFMTSKLAYVMLPKLILSVVEISLPHMIEASHTSLQKASYCSKLIHILMYSQIERHQKNEIKACVEKLLVYVFRLFELSEMITKPLFDLAIDVVNGFQKVGAFQNPIRIINNPTAILNFMSYFINLSSQEMKKKQLIILNELVKIGWKKSIPKGYYKIMIGLFIRLISTLLSENKFLKTHVEFLIKIITNMSKNYNHFYAQTLKKKNLRGTFFHSIAKILIQNQELIISGEINSFLRKIRNLLTNEIAKMDPQNNSNQKIPQVKKMLNSILENVRYFNLTGPSLEEYLISVLNILREMKFEFGLYYVEKIKNCCLSSSYLFVANLSLFHLKNNNYDEFLNLVSNYCSSNKTQIDKFYAVLKRDLTLAQDYVKIICLIEFLKNDNNFHISETKFEIGEYLTFIATILNCSKYVVNFGDQNQFAATFGLKISKMRKNPSNISDLLCILKMGINYLIDPESNPKFHHFVIRIVNLVIVEIGSYSNNIKFTKNEIQKKRFDDDIETRKLRIMTVVDKLQIPLWIDTSFDFDEKKESSLKISAPVFNRLIILIVEYANKRALQIKLEDEDDRLEYLELLQTTLNLIFLFIEHDQKELFNQLKTVLSTPSQPANIYGHSTKWQSRFFELFGTQIERLYNVRISNRYVKICDLLLLFFTGYTPTSQDNLPKFLSRVISESRILSQIMLISGGKFLASFELISRIFKRIFEEKNAFMFIFVLMIHFLNFPERIPESLIAKFLFKLFKRLQSESKSDFDDGSQLFRLINSFSKIIFGTKNLISNASSFFDNSEKQTLHFIRELETSQINLISNVSCYFFNFVMTDYTGSIDFLESKNRKELTEFFFFIILNRLGSKRDRKANNENQTIFQAIEMVFLKKVSENLILNIFIDLSTTLQNGEFHIPVLTKLIEFIYVKFENVVFSKNYKQNFELFLQIMLEKIIFTLKFEENEKSESKFVRKALALIDLLLLKNRNFAYKVLFRIERLPIKCFKLVHKLENLPLQFQIYRLLSRLSKSRDDSFLHIYNDINQSFLSFSHMNIPKIAESKKLIEGFCDLFLEFFDHLVNAFGNMIEPFIKDVFLLSTEIVKLSESARIKVTELLNLISTHVNFRLAFKHIEECIEYSAINSALELFDLISMFTHKTIGNIEFDTFAEKNEEIFRVIEKAIDQVYVFETSETKTADLKSTWVEIFVQFALKCNETQLKSFFAKFQKNACKRMSSKHALLRKELLLDIFQRLTTVIGSFSIVLYSEVIEFCIEFLNEMASEEKRLPNEKRIDSDFYNVVHLKMHSHIMKAVSLLHKNDKVGFVDSYKFEQLIIPILNSIPHFRPGLKKGDLIAYYTKIICPAITGLLLLVNNEYKTKFVVMNLLNTCLRGDKLSKLLSILCIKAIIEAVNESFLAIVHDIILKLSNLANNIDSEISDAVREVIKLIEEMTGENIKEILEREDLNFES